ncbi:hypothetical protein M758_3G040000 [Ceratodon purpureus]|nr:hypothetical protein M758_3G040000 [Ceratodon purpureus]
MWGVLIFLRFFYIVGNAGIWHTFIIISISFFCAILTTLSVSAIATNGPIAEGGTYYLISRALGPKLGGAVGLLYYLGVVLQSVLEVLGSIEMITFTFPELNFTGSTRAIALTILIFLGLLVFFGIKFVSKLSLLFFAIVLYTMLSYYMGLGLAPRGFAPKSLTSLSWTTFQSNWSPKYLSGQSFSSAMSLFFPCFTGILSGVDRATHLKEPHKSIPQGTLGAIVLSFILYTSYIGLWAAVAKRDYLLGNHEGNLAMLLIVKDVAFPLAILTQIGIIIASMSQAIQCLITSPRLLQAIALDGVVPFLRPLAKTSKSEEPQKSLLITIILCILFAMIGSLNVVAPLVSICFLTCYSALNLSCLVSSAVDPPSWRPRWKHYHWSTALLGFLACVAMNFVIVWYWALVAIFLLMFMYIYIDFRQVEVSWGTALGGLCLQIAVQGILSVGHEARYTINWRPQLLCLSKPRSSWSKDGHAGHEFLLFTSQLKKGQGLCVVTIILEGKLEEMTNQVVTEKIELENHMADANVTGFAKVMVAPTYREGKTYAIQSSGLGSLEPNTLILGWPMKWRDEGDYEESAEILLETLSECRAVDKAVLLCMNLNRFPLNDNIQEGAIDVWWIVHDGGLLLLLAHLLQQHKIWRKCKLRVHTVAEKLDNSEIVKKNLEKLLEMVRIEAEVQVLELDESYLAPYTFDYTIRIEEAKAYAKELAKYSKDFSTRRKIEKPDLSISVENISCENPSNIENLQEQSEVGGFPQSSSQMYPGSPAGISNQNIPYNLPEPMQRTWKTFSQNYSPTKLNNIIVEQSKDARMVLINLPDHYKGMLPSSYMEYCEELCKRLDRVLLVHGTGKELWGFQSHLGL